MILTDNYLQDNSAVTDHNIKIVALLHWVNAIGNQTKYFFDYSGGVASSRIQLKPALEAAKRLNIEAEIWSLHSSQPEDLYTIHPPEICLIGKLTSNTEDGINNLSVANISAATHFKRKGSAIILIYSDNHLARKGAIRELYQDLINTADIVVTPTKTLKKQVDSYTNTPSRSFVIEDPWSLQACTYRRAKKSYFNIAWFGSGLNIRYLAREIPAITQHFSGDTQVTFTILSTMPALLKLKTYISSLKYNNKKFKFIFIPWDDQDQPRQLERLLSEADVTIIPSDPADAKKRGVSHNRLVDASRRGCIPIVSPMESYKELAKIAIIGNDFPRMLNFAFEHQERLRKKYESHRDEILKHFSPHENMKKWGKVIELAKRIYNE